MNGHCRVHVTEQDYMGRISITLTHREGDKIAVEHYLPDEKLWRITTIDQGQILPGPTITFNVDDAIELYKELHQFFSARGVRNKQESFMEGELAGTKRHLADMRYLLKLPGVIPTKEEK